MRRSTPAELFQINTIARPSAWVLASLVSEQSVLNSEDGNQNEKASPNIFSKLDALTVSKEGTIETNHIASNVRIGKRILHSGSTDRLLKTLLQMNIPTRTSITSSCKPLVATSDISITRARIDDLLDYLKVKFRHDPRFALPLETRQSLSGIELEHDSPQVANNLQYLNIKMRSDDELLFLCTNSREESMCLQEYVTECPYSELRTIAARLAPFIGHLISHSFANYIIQRILTRDRDFAEFVATYSQKKFEELALNEYSSRVLQTLIETSRRFRLIASLKFSTNMNLGVAKSSSTCLLMACIKNRGDPSEIRFVLNALRKDKALLLSKPFQRVVSCFAMYCSDADLNQLVRLLKVKRKLEIYLDQRQSTFTLVAILQRSHASVVKKFLAFAKDNMAKLLQSKCFKIMLESALESSNHRATSVLKKVLIEEGIHNVKEMIGEHALISFYLYASLVVLSDDDPGQLARFLVHPAIKLSLTSLCIVHF